MQETNQIINVTNCTVHKANSMMQKAYNDNLCKTRPKQPKWHTVLFNKHAIYICGLIDHSCLMKKDRDCHRPDELSILLIFFLYGIKFCNVNLNFGVLFLFKMLQFFFHLLPFSRLSSFLWLLTKQLSWPISYFLKLKI